MVIDLKIFITHQIKQAWTQIQDTRQIVIYFLAKNTNEMLCNTQGSEINADKDVFRMIYWEADIGAVS